MAAPGLNVRTLLQTLRSEEGDAFVQAYLALHHEGLGAYYRVHKTAVHRMLKDQSSGEVRVAGASVAATFLPEPAALKILSKAIHRERDPTTHERLVEIYSNLMRPDYKFQVTRGGEKRQP